MQFLKICAFFLVFLVGVLATTVIIDIALLSKATSTAPNGNFTHQLVTNDLDEDKCYWENVTGLIVTKCTDPMPDNTEVIAHIEAGGTPENYTVWADTTLSDNTFCDLFVVDNYNAKRQVPVGSENAITICGDCNKNFSIFGYVVFKNLENAKDNHCKITLMTNP